VEHRRTETRTLRCKPFTDECVCIDSLHSSLALPTGEQTVRSSYLWGGFVDAGRHRIVVVLKPDAPFGSALATHRVVVLGNATTVTAGW